MAGLRIIFMGTPELAGKSLRALIGAPGLQVVAVATQPDQPKGRGLKLQPSPVKEIALEHRIPLCQPERAREPLFLETLRSHQPDLIAVAAYGQILPPPILALPRCGCLNVHTSLLPKYRGASPIQTAILNGDSETGVTIMKMDAGLDTGDIVSQEKTPIFEEDDAQTLHDRLAKLGAQLLVKTIPDYAAGRILPQPQPSEGATYAAKIRKEDGQIDWRQPARAIWNRIRAFTPWPGAFTRCSAANPTAAASTVLIKCWQAEPVDQSGAPGIVMRADKNGIIVGCGQDALRILALQREGGRRMTAQEFLAGHPLQPGQKFG